MILDRLKAWCALFGAIATGLLGLGVIPAGSWQTGLTIAAAIFTGVVTYQVPNIPPPVIQSGGMYASKRAIRERE